MVDCKGDAATQTHFLEKSQLLFLDIFRSQLQLINTSIQFQSSYILSHSSMTSLNVAVIHAELAVLKSVSIVPFSQYNSGQKWTCCRKNKTCFFEEMVTQEIPYNGQEYLDSFLITGHTCLPRTCQKMASIPVSVTVELQHIRSICQEILLFGDPEHLSYSFFMFFMSVTRLSVSKWNLASGGLYGLR